MKKMKSWLLFLFTLSTIAGLEGQTMEVTDATTPPFTPQNLITNIFLGDGVEVLNVTYEGDPLAVGYFKDGQNAVGIDRGIIMTTGRAASTDPNCTGPLGSNCVGTQFASNDNASTAIDADLASIASGGLNTFDVAKFTITFIPTADTLRFRYVFASEEYPEYSCSIFNDVFGFFISGPGITGPFQNNAKNIALIPGTNTPVTINNVHPQNGAGCPPAFVQFYNDNATPNQPVYDGHLNVFTAEAIVIPCETYTIKLSISDVGDGVFDTGVFLEAKSFGTGSLDVQTETVSLDGTITEGCATGSMTFSFPGPVESDYPLDYTIIGTAENGVDYEFIPGDIFIPAGDSTVSITIVGIVDNIPEGLETIGIDIQRDICNRDTFWIFIRDNEILPPDLGLDTTICRNDSLQLDGSLPIPLPIPPSFNNPNDYVVTHTAPAYSPILVAGVQPITLGPGVIRSVCVNIEHKWVDDLDLFLITPGGQFIELSSDNGSNCDNYNNVCFTPTASTPINSGVFSPCTANVQAPFSGGTFLPEGIWSDLWDGNYPTNGTWQLLALDDQAGFNGTILDWTITFEPLYQLYYRWEPETGLSCSDCPDPVATPQTTTTYILTAWDTYGCEVQDTINIEVKDVLPAPDVICTTITNNSITFEWNQVSGAMGYQVNVEGAGWTVPNNGPLSHIVTGLTLSDTVSIQVFAIGECDGEIGTAVCNTPPCDAPTLSLVSVSNLNCPGDSDGEITVSATGGAGDYVYEIGGISNTTGVFTSLTDGVYQVIVTDAWNCPNSIQVPVQVPDPLLLTEIIVSEISCNGSQDGAVTVSVTGGAYPYSFEWNGVATDSVFTTAGPGQQSVIVTDANGCSATASLDLTEPEVLALTMTADSVNCFGASDGAATVAIAGGTLPYTIEWDAAAGNSFDPQAQNLAAGSYTVLVTDANGCQVSETVLVQQPEQIVTSIASQNPLCNGAANGEATVTVTGGIPGYIYLWSNGINAATANGLDATSYTVLVTDANGCEATDAVSLTEPDAIAVAFQTQNVSCFEGTNGEIVAQANGGTSPYTYLWSNASTNADLTNLQAGEYCLTVTGSNGCSTVLCETVTQPEEILLTTLPTSAGCNGGSAGSVDLSVSGGTGPFTYQWSNNAVTQDINNLAAGGYDVVVTDALNCTAQTSVTIGESEAVQIQLSQQNVACRGNSTGSIDLTPSGGTGIFTYTWNGPNGFSASSQDLTGIAAGSYTLVVQDSEGCNATASTLILEPATAVVVSIAQPQMICFNATNGTATATAAGGAGNYTFSWSNNQSSAVANNLPAGIYTVTATDAAGCTDTEQVQIMQQGALALQLGQTPATCFNALDGEAAILSITQGGSSVPVSNFNINWSAGNQTTPGITGLTGGQTYSVTITGNLGCTATSSITIGNPASIGASVVSTQNVKCARGSDGAITVTGNGGTAPYSYLWGNNAAGQTTATASNLPSGTFAVTVSDANGCSTSIQASINEPTALDVSFLNQKVLCFGGADGSSIATPAGGTPPYSLNWSNGASGLQATDLSAGIIYLTLTDANGCKLVDSTNIAQPQEPVSALYEVQDVKCTGLKNGSIQVNAAGGSPPYRYSLNGTDFYGSSNIIALASDVYDVTIRDNNGCTYQLNDIFVNEPEPLGVDLGPDTILFYGYSVNVIPNIINGDPDEVTYLWSSNNPRTPANYPEWPVGNFMVTSPATVTLTITNENGCTASDMINLFVREIRGIQVPTGFAPGDGGNPLNDLLHVHGNAEMVKKIRLFRVFDRWGEMIFEMQDFDINDTTIGWDGTFKGKEMPAGTYVWYLEVDFIDGVSETYKGNTTLMR